MYVDLTTFTGVCNTNLGSPPKCVVFKLTQQKHPQLEHPQFEMSLGTFHTKKKAHKVGFCYQI